jgi:histidinol-phosphate aminotransferase
VARGVEAVRSPFNTSSVAQAAALAALGDRGHVARSRRENRAEGRFLQRELRRRRVDFVASVANFILVRTGLGGEEMHQRMLRRGVIVRPLEAYGYKDAIRVSIGTHADNQRFLQALDACLEEPAATHGMS